MTVAIWLVLLACTIAVVTDVTARRIPNVLTGGLALVAFGLNALHGWQSLAVSAGACVAVLALGMFAFSLGWLGGGDVKLMAAAGAALSFPDVVPFLIYTAIAGGVVAVGYSLVTGRLLSVLGSVALVLRPLAYKGTAAVAPRQPVMLPYGIAIALGALAVALSHTAAPFLRLPL